MTTSKTADEIRGIIDARNLDVVASHFDQDNADVDPYVVCEGVSVTIGTLGSMTARRAANPKKEADATFGPRGRTPNQTPPPAPRTVADWVTLAVEVGRYQTWASLVEAAQWWCNYSGIQYILLLKIGPEGFQMQYALYDIANRSRRYQSPVAMSSSSPLPSLPTAAQDSAIESLPTSALSPTATPLAWSTPCSSSQAASQAVDVPLAQATVESEAEKSDAEGAEELAIDEVDSDEPDDSADEDWSTGDASIEDEVEEALTGESTGSETEVEEDISNSLLDLDMQQRVSKLIREDKCEHHCLEGKARELEWLICSLGQMTKGERTTCILTLIGVLMQTDTSVRRRRAGERETFHYYLPLVGHICRPSFANCLGVQPLTIQRYKRRVREGNISAKVQGNKLNKNASKIDAVWLVKWFIEFAAGVGEVVPVRVRTQKTKDGVVKKYYSRENYTLLPATFTWEALYEDMHQFVSLGLRVNTPALSTFRKLLSLHCPNIKIRSAQANVCDLCTIYQARMKRGATAEQTEELGQHTESTQRMRREYKKDKAAATKSESDVAVIVMDFSQNLTIPSVTSTHSQWYFCSLLAVNVFGIFYENEGTQTIYLYDEFSSGKGSDQINSMLHHFIRTVILPAGKKQLIVYADNCSGQNKNNLVIKFS
ncbi:unnamed protein product [Phytophthora fragariaefolia]|uniref:Unnamed protein product n=1 Tax=Phytophthora fragariaefolia TaxID=1490495 RepID=A0A9W6XTI6_9STRA|nr:unnamed protein product [Phytophthora fragariaefolia]